MRPVLSPKALGQRAIAESLVRRAWAAGWWSSPQLPPAMLPSPLTVLNRLIDIAGSPNLSWHVLITSLRVLASVVLALALGFLLALLAHSVPWLAGIVM